MDGIEEVDEINGVNWVDGIVIGMNGVMNGLNLWPTHSEVLSLVRGDLGSRK